MVSFNYINPTRIVFGRSAEKQIGALTSAYSNKALIHYGSERIIKSGLMDVLTNSLNAAGVEFTLLGGGQPNPRSSLVYKGIEIVKNKNIGIIIAVGGGSVIDSAKAIGIGAAYEGDFQDFFGSRASDTPKASVPVGVVLTMAGAGSEASNNCVITNDKDGTKNPCGSEVIYPVFALMNPELTTTVPEYQTMCGITDAISHAMERYFSPTENTDITDRMLEGIISSLMHNALLLKDDLTNYDLRAEIMLGCKVAHDNCAGVGRVQDWASHQMEHQISALYDVAHGAGLAVVMPAWMEYISAFKPDRLVALGKRVFAKGNEPWTASDTIGAFRHFLKEIGMPIRMHELCPAVSEDYPKMAKMALDYNCGSIGQYRKLYQQDVETIYKLME